MMTRMIVTLALLLCATKSVLACDTTLSSGASRASIDSALSTYSHVCLGSGTFNLGSTTLNIPQNKTLDGASMATTTISSSADRAIGLASGANAWDFTLIGGGGSTNEYGVLTYQTSGATVANIDIQGFLISIGVVNSYGTSVLNVFASDNGDQSNGQADPNVYIDNSDNTWLYYGSVTGDGTHPFGDGEISCYNSDSVHIEGTASWASGTSAVFFVNCDNATIEDMDIYWPGGGCPRFCVNGPQAGNCRTARRRNDYSQTRGTRRAVVWPVGELQEA